VRHGTIVTTRKATAGNEKLTVHPPRGWNVAAGTGAVPNAIDINHDWYPRTWEAARKIVIEAFGSLLESGRLKTPSRTADPAAHNYLICAQSHLYLSRNRQRRFGREDGLCVRSSPASVVLGGIWA
jgi:hypothetical protein